jgi:hypothetical protein
MSGPKWVDLARFGAKLELVADPALRKRRLRLLVHDPARFQDAVAGRAYGSIDLAERQKVAAAFEEAMRAMGLRYDGAEGAQRIVRQPGARDIVLYSEDIRVTFGKLNKLLPPLMASDFVDATILSPSGEAFQWHDATRVREVLSRGDGVHVKQNTETGRFEPVDSGSAPRFYLSTQIRLAERMGDMLASVSAIDAGYLVDHRVIQHLSAEAADGALEVWTTPQACADATGTVLDDVVEAELPFSAPVAFHDKRRSLVVLPDLRFLPGDLESLVSSRTKEAATARELAHELASAAAFAVQQAGALDSETYQQVLVDFAAMYDKRLPRIAGRITNLGNLGGVGLAARFGALTQRARVSGDEWLDQAQIHLARLERDIAAWKAAQPAPEQTLTTNTFSSAIESSVGASLDENVWSLNEIVKRVIPVAQAMLPTSEASFIGSFEEPQRDSGAGLSLSATEFNERRSAVRQELLDILSAAPLGSWAVLKGASTADSPYWYGLMTLGDGSRLSTALGNGYHRASPPTHSEILANTLQNYVYRVKERLHNTREHARNAAMLTHLLAQGLVVGYELKNKQIAGMDFARAQVTAIHVDAARVCITGARKVTGRRAQTQTVEVSATSLAEAIGATSRSNEGTLTTLSAPVLPSQDSPTPSPASRQSSSSSEDRIEDVGEKIGGARKDFYAKRLTVSDLVTMNDMEKASLVSKHNIWPKLDYEAMRQAGIQADAAYAIKWLKDKIEVVCPNVQHAELYIRGVSAIQDAMAPVKTLDEFKQACQQVFKSFEDIDPKVIGYSWTSNSGLHASIGHDAIRTLYDPFRAVYMAQRKTQRGQTWGPLIKAPTRTEKSGNDVERYRPARPHLDKLQRQGHDHRNGRDITGTDMMETFGFRAIEFGNWLPQDERQLVLNHAYDAFHDLASATGLPIKAMSLEGQLALAFGARGKGQFSAHFEPGRMVCNMTRIRGAGAVAHEWGHALDRWLSLRSASDVVFLSDGRLKDEAEPSIAIMHRLMTSLRSAPVAIDAGIAKAERKVHSMRNMALSNITGFATYDSYTRFKRESNGFSDSQNAARSSYLDTARALIEEAFAKIGDAAVAHDPGLAKQAFNEFQLSKRLRDVYRLNGGDDKSFLSGKTAFCLSQWEEHATEHLATLKSLLELKEKGCVFTPARPLACRGVVSENTELAVDKTAFLSSAVALDAKRKTPYFSNPTELFARAFEAFVFDSLKNSGRKNDYLVHAVEEDRYADRDRYAGNPYPVGIERERFRKEFGSALEVLGTAFEARKELEHESPSV